jgi:hypothetical protein
MHFRDLLLHFSSEVPELYNVIRDCLEAVGMTADAYSDQRKDKNIVFPMPARTMPKLEVPVEVPSPADADSPCNGTVYISCPCKCHQKK